VLLGYDLRWITPAIADLQRLPILGALPYFVLLVIWQASQLALFAIAGRAVSLPTCFGQALSRASIIASCWVLLEYAFPRVIPWCLADCLAASPRLNRVADLGGAYGLSWVLVWTSALAAEAWMATASLHRFGLGSVAMATVLCLGIYGTMPIETTPSSRMIDVAIVQGSIKRSESDDVRAANAASWAIYHQLTESMFAVGATKSTRPPDLVLWPETTLRSYLQHDLYYSAQLQRLARQLGGALMLGALGRGEEGARTGEYNSAFVYRPDAARPEHYSKRHLLAFGEYAPGPFLWAGWRTTGDFAADLGSHPSLMRFSARDRDASSVAGGSVPRSRWQPTVHHAAPSICFEALTPGGFNTQVQAGADLLVNLSDDGWFGPDLGPILHLNGVRLRAVETRRWLLRASGSGISAIVAPDGSVVESLDSGVRNVLRYPVPLRSDLTFYIRWGNWPVLLSTIGVAMAMLLRLRRA